jgi:hypothetical protein
MDGNKPAMVINGEPWWRYSYEYDFDGGTYAFDVVAKSEIEAHARMKKIALARFVGQMSGNPIPVSRGGFLVPIICWWRNLFA